MRSTILLVDDEKQFRDSSQRLLTRKGYDVMTAQDGQRGLELLTKNPVDLVLLDLKMPVMGGEEFLQAMCPLYPDIPVVVITGHGSLDTAINCMRKGAYDFITKPFDIPQLLLSIERALEKRNLERKAKDYQEETVRNLLELSTEKKKTRDHHQLHGQRNHGDEQEPGGCSSQPCPSPPSRSARAVRRFRPCPFDCQRCIPD